MSTEKPPKFVPDPWSIDPDLAAPGKNSGRVPDPWAMEIDNAAASPARVRALLLNMAYALNGGGLNDQVRQFLARALFHIGSGMSADRVFRLIRDSRTPEDGGRQLEIVIDYLKEKDARNSKASEVVGKRWGITRQSVTRLARTLESAARTTMNLDAKAELGGDSWKHWRQHRAADRRRWLQSVRSKRSR